MHSAFSHPGNFIPQSMSADFSYQSNMYISCEFADGTKCYRMNFPANLINHPDRPAMWCVTMTVSTLGIHAFVLPPWIFDSLKERSFKIEKSIMTITEPDRFSYVWDRSRHNAIHYDSGCATTIMVAVANEARTFDAKPIDLHADPRVPQNIFYGFTDCIWYCLKCGRWVPKRHCADECNEFVVSQVQEG